MRILGNKPALLLLAALTALLIAGCGGGGGGTESTATTTTEEPQKLTKAELIQQGDAICAEVNAAVGALGSSETEEAVGAGQDEKVANLYVGMVERLQELGTPEGGESSYAEFTEATEELAKVEGEVKLAAEREDIPALEEAKAEAEPALEEFETRAGTYGFEDCSKGPGAVTPAGNAAGEPGTGSSSEETTPELEEGGVEPEEFVEPAPEEAAPEEVAPETGGAGGAPEAAPEPAPETGGESGGVGPG